MQPRWVPALRLVGVGWSIGIAIVGGLGGGIWLDGKWHTKPIFTLIGLFLGIVVAFYSTYKLVKPLLNLPDTPKRPKPKG